MKTLITYYSYSGNTDKTAQVLAKFLKTKGEVAVQRLKPKDEITSFTAQCKAAFFRKRSELQDGITFNASSYDLVLVGSPVWAFAPTPAVNTYLDNLSGLNGKKAIIFLTFGSSAGVKKCFRNISSVLQSKGAYRIDEIGIQQGKVTDEDYIISSLNKIL